MGVGHNNDKRYDAAVRITREAGEIALDFFRQAENNDLAVESKGIQDFVTAADRAVENHIRTALASAFPQDGFLGEEGGGRNGATGCWVLDPIDGTSNFLRGIDHWGISLAYCQGASIRLGLVYNPVIDILYSARAGQGAWCNEAPVKVSEQRDPERSMVILGHSSRQSMNLHLAAIRFLENKHIDYRRFGSAALGLAYVADGKAEGYFEAHLNSWDALAGVLIVAEAGGSCTPFPVNNGYPVSGCPVLACSPALWSHLRPLLDLTGDDFN